MTTIRERSTAALAEALTGYGGASDPMDVTLVTQHARSILAASPTLARRLDLGTAWDEAVAALPEGWFCVVQRVWSGTWEAYAMPSTTSPRQSSKGATPTDALLALAAKLREATR